MFRIALLILGSLAAWSTAGFACTNILVSRGASKDGSVFIAFSVDGAALSNLNLQPARDVTDAAPDPLDPDWRGRTCRVLGFMNEHQLAIGETTTAGHRPEVGNPKTGLNYGQLMFLALKRCKTARQAIAEIDRLMQKHGYGSSPEVLSIGDKNEAWLMEIVSKGPREKGAVWVAARVPEGYIAVHGNMNRVTTFPMDDPDNWLYSADVVDYAAKRGYYDTSSAAPFNFRAAYHPAINKFIKRVCAGRVWSISRRAAPSQNYSADYFRGVAGAKDYPLFVKPDKKLAIHDMMRLMRDHFEGTPFDMTKGVASGAFNSPYRYRGLDWEVDGRKYSWERPVSSQQAACTWIAQSRNWLPDEVGGVYWYTPDDAFVSCFAPFYVGINQVPKSYRTGNHDKFSWDSAWWVFNLVSNWTYERWSRVLPDVQKVQQEQEAKWIAMQPVIDEAAVKLAKGDKKLMREFLTGYCDSSGEALFRKWQELAGFVFTKHIDGWVHDIGQPPQGVGYSQEWLRRVIKDRPQQYSIEEQPK